MENNEKIFKVVEITNVYDGSYTDAQIIKAREHCCPAYNVMHGRPMFTFDRSTSIKPEFSNIKVLFTTSNLDYAKNFIRENNTKAFRKTASLTIDDETKLNKSVVVVKEYCIIECECVDEKATLSNDELIVNSTYKRSNKPIVGEDYEDIRRESNDAYHLLRVVTMKDGTSKTIEDEFDYGTFGCAISEYNSRVSDDYEKLVKEGLNVVGGFIKFGDLIAEIHDYPNEDGKTYYTDILKME